VVVSVGSARERGVLHAEARRARRLDHRRPHHGEGQPDTPWQAARVKAVNLAPRSDGSVAVVQLGSGSHAPPPGSSTKWLTPVTLFGLAFAPGFAAQAGSFTPSRTHHHRSGRLEHASVGSVGDLPSLDTVAASTNTARARVWPVPRGHVCQQACVDMKAAIRLLQPRHAHGRRAEHLDQVLMGSARGLLPLRMAAATCSNEEKAMSSGQLSAGDDVCSSSP
jgi:hypothetical protein